MKNKLKLNKEVVSCINNDTMGKIVGGDIPTITDLTFHIYCGITQMEPCTQSDITQCDGNCDDQDRDTNFTCNENC